MLVITGLVSSTVVDLVTEGVEFSTFMPYTMAQFLSCLAIAGLGGACTWMVLAEATGLDK